VSQESLLKVQERAGLNWRSWWDGPDGPIAHHWSVELFPTLYLIDHHGVIRFESQGVPDLDTLDREINKLVQEAS